MSEQSESILDDIAAVLQDPKIAAAEEAYWEWERKRSESLHRLLSKPLRLNNNDLAPMLQARTLENAILANESAGGPGDAMIHQASTGKVYRYGPGPRPCLGCGRRSYTPLCWGCHGIADLGTIRPPADHMGDA